MSLAIKLFRAQIKPMEINSVAKKVQLRKHLKWKQDVHIMSSIILKAGLPWFWISYNYCRGEKQVGALHIS